MEPWSIGLVVLVVVGLAVITYGALHDRARNRRRAAAMLAPPPRSIPRLEPQTPGPAYVTELQARRPPAGPDRSLSPADRAALDTELAAATTVEVACGYLSADFGTDRASGWAVLDDPVVVVCAGRIGTVRELLAIFERVITSRSALVLVAESFAPDVRDTLEVNALQRKLALIAVEASPQQAATIADAAHARLLDQVDRLAGYLAPDQLGRCARWVSTKDRSQLVLPAELTPADLASA